jgi:hypothetical protein
VRGFRQLQEQLIKGGMAAWLVPVDRKPAYRLREVAGRENADFRMMMQIDFLLSERVDHKNQRGALSGRTASSQPRAFS